jgi:GTP-binding protein SAR1
MSFLFNWISSSTTSLFHLLGLYNPKASVLFLGLDNAGKTTLLHVLSQQTLSVHEPTRHPQHGEVMIGQVKCSTHDLGGHAAARRLWKNYCTSVDGIVFVVDASDAKRMPEVKEELATLLTMEGLETTPVLVLGNKSDHKEAVSEEILKDVLGLDTTGKTIQVGKDVQPIELFMCSVVKKEGYVEGFKWFVQYLK